MHVSVSAHPASGAIGPDLTRFPFFSALRCWKDYDGERCEIQSLGSKRDESGSGELTQTVLVIIAVVLSVISCLAILLMACAQ